MRLCPEWARLEPENGRVDPWAVEHYQHVFTAAVDAGLRPWIALVDRSLPGWFGLDERGFRDRRARSYFWPRHVERCAELFGEWAHAWVPIVAPFRLARAGYLTGTAPPGRTDAGRFLDTLAGLHLGLGEAWRVLRGGAPVAAAFDVAEVRPADREPTTRARARRVEDLLWAWTTALRDGQVTLPDWGAVAAPALADACDLIGLVVADRLTVPEDGDWGAQPVPEDVGGLVRRAAEEGPDRPIVVLGQRVARPRPPGGHAGRGAGRARRRRRPAGLVRRARRRRLRVGGRLRPPPRAVGPRPQPPPAARPAARGHRRGPPR